MDGLFKINYVKQIEKILIAVVLLINTFCYSQNFNGDFTSYKTSFQDFSSTKNNFVEETEFKIAVIINENNNDGRIVIQDPRIPKKLLVYKVITYLGEVEDDGITSFLFNGITDHLQNPIEVNLVFYYPKDKKLSLMVYSKETSQVFFDLVKVNLKLFLK